MILIELTGDEGHPAYQELAVSNGERQYDFLKSIVTSALALNKPFLSQQIIRALNYHAIACLHPNAGELRPCQVTINGSPHQPPEYFRVQSLMDDFINSVNHAWESTDPVVLATFVLWRLNHIHPFINGNGRTARAACLFVLCVKFKGWIAGEPILPELIKKNKVEYTAALVDADESAKKGVLDLSRLHILVASLLDQQVSTARPELTVANNPSNPEKQDA